MTPGFLSWTARRIELSTGVGGAGLGEAEFVFERIKFEVSTRYLSKCRFLAGSCIYKFGVWERGWAREINFGIVSIWMVFTVIGLN